jgi:acyl dehydratase
VRQSAALSGDTQPRHTEPDEEGRLLVHGLLTATLPTKLGGDVEVLAHRMTFAFHEPVHTGERVVCEWTTESVTQRGERHELVASTVCRGDGPAVLTGEVEGLVR